MDEMGGHWDHRKFNARSAPKGRIEALYALAPAATSPPRAMRLEKTCWTPPSALEPTREAELEGVSEADVEV
jgi:hypothetical protein